jgi:hypothetical protein
MYRNRLIGYAGAALAATLAIAPAAQAGTTTPDNWAVRPGPTAMTLTSQGQVLPDDRASRVGPSSLVMSQPVTLRSTPGTGFNWGDAAVGAAGAFGLSLVAGGAAAGVRSRRRELAV